MIGRPLWLIIGVLWLAAGCVVPPAEVEEPGNRLPYIDWSSTSPPTVELSIQKGALQVTTFSIENAVEDPDGDEIETQWYWLDDAGVPHREFGELTLTLNEPCYGIKALREADRITVEVVVSDQPDQINWLGEKDNPVDLGVDEQGNPLPLIKRVWVVDLEGECP